MTKRPTSISVISWILIVIRALTMITTTLMIATDNPMVRDMVDQSPIPTPLYYILSYLGSLIIVLSGVAMLKGKNWARILYVIWSVIDLVIGFATSPMKAAIIPSFVGFLVITFFLFRPKATAFFLPREVPENA